MKKILAFLCSIVMLFSIAACSAPAPSSAPEQPQEEPNKLLKVFKGAIRATEEDGVYMPLRFSENTKTN